MHSEVLACSIWRGNGTVKGCEQFKKVITVIGVIKVIKIPRWNLITLNY